MPIVPLQVDVDEEYSAIRLARYAQIIQYDERRFWGIAVGVEPSNHCRNIWTLSQRLNVARYLADAQIEMEEEVGFPIGRRWIVEPQRSYACEGPVQYSWVREGGIQAVSIISAGAAVVLGTDPAVIGPIAYVGTDTWEIHVYHPGTSYEIDPSEVTITGGNLTIKIPRARLVKISKCDNPAAGLDYNDLNNYSGSVDVKRVYNDPSTQAVLLDNHVCSSICASGGCSNFVGDGCIHVNETETGIVEVYPASYASGSWVRSSQMCRSGYRWMQLNYLAGKDPTKQMEDAIVRLAHSKMPGEPCGCDPAKALWARDRFVPTVLTAERLNCPFGLSDGAWFAFTQANMMKVTRGAGIL